MLLPSRRRLAPVLLVAALAAATVAVAGTGPGAAGMITCEEFVKMKVIDEVKAIAAGRVPRECRDRKTEHQRRDQRKRAASQRGAGGRPAPSKGAAGGSTRPLRELLRGWPLGQLQRPADYRLPIPSFDFATELTTASSARNADLPFVVRNVPDVARTAAAWSRDPDSVLAPLFGELKFGVTRSSSPSFLYHDTKSSTPTWIGEHRWVSPTDTLEMNYSEWRQANEDATDGRYYYGMATVPNTYSAGSGSKYRFGFLADALPSMTKDSAPPLLAPSPNKLNWHGLDCRLGHPSIFSEAHYDFKRNIIAMLAGEKRYLILPPTACSDLSLLPYGHPSARHSKIMLARLSSHGVEGLSRQSLTGSEDDTPPSADDIERFFNAPALDVHLAPGDVLHLPAYWFHAVLSLTQTVQCNSFVGAPSTTVAQDFVEDCMMRVSGEQLPGHERRRHEL